MNEISNSYSDVRNFGCYIHFATDFWILLYVEDMSVKKEINVFVSMTLLRLGIEAEDSKEQIFLFMWQSSINMICSVKNITWNTG